MVNWQISVLALILLKVPSAWTIFCYECDSSNDFSCTEFWYHIIGQKNILSMICQFTEKRACLIVSDYYLTGHRPISVSSGPEELLLNTTTRLE